MVIKAYTNGVSTRKIKHLAETLGIENISAGEVKKASTPSPLHPENSSSSCNSASSPSSVFFCYYDNCFLKCTDEPAHILIMINFFCIPKLSLHKVYLHEQYGKESTHKEIYRT